MREGPILMKGSMVRATLADLKTQTRRIVKEDRHPDWGNIYTPGVIAGEPQHVLDRMCPYGAPGDQLWVKETFRFASNLDPMSPAAIAEDALEAGYKRPWAPTKYEADDATNNADFLHDFGAAWGRTRVSIHMPRWASRITLEVTGVRVERLQEITPEDAKAEGALEWWNSLTDEQRAAAPLASYCPEIRAFSNLWQSINAKPTPVKGDDGRISHYVSYPWENVRETRTHRGKPWHVIGNPHVWVIGFRIESEVATW